MEQGIVPTQCGSLLEIVEGRLELLEIEQGQGPVQVGEGEVLVAAQRGTVTRNCLLALVALVKDAAEVVMAPGKIRLQTGTATKVSGGQQQLPLFPVADAALDQRPVVVGVQAERRV